MPSPVIGRGTNGGIRFRRSFDRGWTYYSITDAESTAFFKIFHTLFFDDLTCRRCARTRRAGAMRKLTDASPYGRCARGRGESRSLPLQTMRAWARLCSKSAAAPSLAVIRTFFAGSCGPARLLRTSHAMARRRGTGRDALRERFSMGAQRRRSAPISPRAEGGTLGRIPGCLSFRAGGRGGTSRRHGARNGIATRLQAGLKRVAICREHSSRAGQRQRGRLDGAARCQGKALSRGRGKMRSSGERERPKHACDAHHAPVRCAVNGRGIVRECSGAWPTRSKCAA